MIHREVNGSVVTLAFENGKVNAMDIEFLGELSHHLDDTEGVGAFILTGRGRAFSAGVDLVRLLGEGNEYIKRFFPALNALLFKAYTLPLPVVAAINGHSIAGGCILSCCCDYRIMPEASGKIGAVELKVGVAYPFTALEILRASIVPSKVNDVVLVANTFTPEKALDLGLIDEVCKPEVLMERSLEVAGGLSQIPMESFKMAKQHLRAEVTSRIESIGPEGDQRALDVWLRPETHQTIRRYMGG